MGPLGFQNPGKASGAGYDANGRCQALEIFGPIKGLRRPHEGRDLYRLSASFSVAGFRTRRKCLGVIWLLPGPNPPFASWGPGL